MNNKQAKIFAAEIGADIPVLDLHSLYPTEALEKIETFVFDMHKNKQDMGRIIYGGGTGVLRQEVLQYLEKHPLVEDVVEEGGSCLVLI
ncbi:MAG: Smr/MutS family protein [Candidatus Magasanikbacteria bacterium]